MAIHPSYNRVSGIHRGLFGENYRKEWATTVKLPLINISRVYGGLSPERYGGGMETKSVRLIDKTGKEWVVRSVEKVPDKLLPVNLRQTFALDWVDDEYSGQHPYSALIVPPLAEAAHVPHANPVIGVLSPDSALGTFNSHYAGRVVLLEEREPTGASVNTGKMEQEILLNDNNHLDGEEVLRARMLDLLVGDWDRHEDQWRWTVARKGKDKIYTAVPRDRDQVLHVTQGLFPVMAAQPWIDPVLGNFTADISEVKYNLMKTRFLQSFPDVQLSYANWMKVVNEFVRDESDSVLLSAVNRLPHEDYLIRGKKILSILKSRRDAIPAAMERYYRFINRIADIRTSDQGEYITVSDGNDSSMTIAINKLTKPGEIGDPIWNLEYKPEITKEVRLYLLAGNDHLIINTVKTPIKLRVVDSSGIKQINVRQSNQKIRVYGKTDSLSLSGDLHALKIHGRGDTTSSRYVPTDLYNYWTPLMTGAFNRDDGFLLGIGWRYTGKDGFRKLPYSTVQELMVTHSFETNAFRIDYSGQWLKAVGAADITLKAVAEAPDNTMNFFGDGNETVLNKNGDYLKFYRARFDFYRLDPALRWHLDKSTVFSTGPSLQFYHTNSDENQGRAVSEPGYILSYDKSNYQYDKVHLGLNFKLISDHRNNNLLPSSGYYLNIIAQGYDGVNQYSKAFAQLQPEFTFYQKIDTGARLVLTDRVGGGIGIGNPAYYQSFFLGGQGNLLGYLQNRFAGQQIAFNNLQARFRLANIAGYILPGELGLSGFYDVGRVWFSGENSSVWHQGVGGGLYFAPASLTVIQVLFGHSNEGWYPYISFNFRL